MEIETQLQANKKDNILMQTLKKPQNKRRILLFLNILLLIVGGTGNPLIVRVYFLHGGHRKWFASLLQTVGFPFLLVPLIFSFFRRSGSSRLFSLTSPLLFYCALLGLITGISDYLYSYGISFLPVSTSSLLISTQLGFTAVFAFFMVKQKFTSFSINAVVLLTFGAVVLGVHSDGDRPDGESKTQYYIGFLMTLGSAVTYGMVSPLVELLYKHAKQEVTYALVLEMQFIIGFSATVFCGVGMVINRDFQAISREARVYGLGKADYCLVVLFTTIISQFFFVGLVGTIKYSSALLSGVIIAFCIPIIEVLSVFFFHEKFDGEKGVALALSLYGTASYFYGEYKEYKKSKANVIDSSQLLPVSLVVSEPTNS